MSAGRPRAPRVAPRRLTAFAGLAALAAAGFGLGVVAGGLWEDPGLVIGYALGRTEAVAWGPGAPVEPEAPVAASEAERPPLGASREPGRAAAPPPVAAAPPPEVAPPPVAAAPPRAAPAPPRAAAARPSAPASGGLAVQVGAFAESGAAEALAASLRAKGYPVYVSPGAGAGEARWRVRVGPLADRGAAERTAEALRRQERLPTWVLSEGG